MKYLVTKHKTIFLLISLLLGPLAIYAQSFNEENKELSMFLTRMYKAEPFEGVKVVTDYDNTYLLSVLTLEKSKYPNQSVINRVAGVKAMSQASQYFNGSSVSTEMIIRATEKTDGTADVETIEKIKENSMGYIKALEQLTNFEDKNGRQVFIFYKKINSSTNNATTR